mmetsp:Transcript_72968/g.202466  ORF Transcript_72968/g.202466 Transcript_72968/m.202466 type:complete len:249 (+) Transcript_72968:179-925(+)
MEARVPRPLAGAPRHCRWRNWLWSQPKPELDIHPRNSSWTLWLREGFGRRRRERRKKARPRGPRRTSAQSTIPSVTPTRSAACGGWDAGPPPRAWRRHLPETEAPRAASRGTRRRAHPKRTAQRFGPRRPTGAPPAPCRREAWRPSRFGAPCRRIAPRPRGPPWPAAGCLRPASPRRTTRPRLLWPVSAWPRTLAVQWTPQTSPRAAAAMRAVRVRTTATQNMTAASSSQAHGTTEPWTRGSCPKSAS